MLSREKPKKESCVLVSNGVVTEQVFCGQKVWNNKIFPWIKCFKFLFWLCGVLRTAILSLLSRDKPKEEFQERLKETSEFDQKREGIWVILIPTNFKYQRNFIKSVDFNPWFKNNKLKFEELFCSDSFFLDEDDNVSLSFWAKYVNFWKFGESLANFALRAKRINLSE